MPVYAMLVSLLILAGCATVPERHVKEYISLYGNGDALPERFEFCYGHNCQRSMSIGFTPQQWHGVRDIFTPPPRTAAEERERISRAVGRMETFAGRTTGTEHDKGGTFGALFKSDQLDCVDEAINTGTYLYLMEREGLIRFHSLREPAHRGFFFIAGWPHVAIVIVETGSGTAYAVDSWFLDNGHPAVIVPLELWMTGWKPGMEGDR